MNEDNEEKTNLNSFLCVTSMLRLVCVVCVMDTYETRSNAVWCDVLCTVVMALVVIRLLPACLSVYILNIQIKKWNRKQNDLRKRRTPNQSTSLKLENGIIGRGEPKRNNNCHVWCCVQKESNCEVSLALLLCVLTGNRERHWRTLSRPALSLTEILQRFWNWSGGTKALLYCSRDSCVFLLFLFSRKKNTSEEKLISRNIYTDTTCIKNLFNGTITIPIPIPFPVT